MPTKPVQISLDTELLKRIDADEETRTHGRSAFMRSAVERYLKARQRAQVDARIRTAYAGAHRRATHGDGRGGHVHAPRIPD